jgi:RimJ/RimL family protein N-acetyltransferase
MRSPEPLVLAGHGVTLEPLGRQHVDDLTVAAADPAIWAWTGPGRMDSRAAVATYVEDALADAGRVPFAVVVDGHAAGSTSYLDIDVSVQGLEIGHTWYRPELWATAVNPACKLLLLGHAFDVLGAQRVTLKTDARNARSRAAISKLGCAYDGTLRHHRLRPDGSVRDTACFSLLVAEWPAARARLQERVGLPGLVPVCDAE